MCVVLLLNQHQYWVEEKDEVAEIQIINNKSSDIRETLTNSP